MIKTLFYIALIGVIIYSGVLFGLPYYNYKVFKSDMDDMAKIEVALNMNDEKFSKKILKHAKDANIPITMENISISRDKEYQKNRDIVVKWSQTVDLFGLYQYTYQFKIDTEH